MSQWKVPNWMRALSTHSASKGSDTVANWATFPWFIGDLCHYNYGSSESISVSIRPGLAKKPRQIR